MLSRLKKIHPSNFESINDIIIMISIYGHETGVWVGKPIGRVRVKVEMDEKFSPWNRRVGFLSLICIGNTRKSDHNELQLTIFFNIISNDQG